MFDTSLPPSASDPASTGHRVLSGLFLGAAVSVDLVMAASLRDAGVGVTVVYLGLTFGQLVLLALWCHRSAVPWSIRGLATALTAWLFAFSWGRASYATCGQWFVMLGLFTTVVALLVAALPYLFDPAQPAAARDRANPPDATMPMRWTLHGMLGIMTAVAILLGAGRWLLVDGARSSVVFHWAAVTAVACGTLLAFRAPVRTVLRITLITATVLSAGALVARVDPILSSWNLTAAYFLEAVVISCGVDVLWPRQKSCRSI